MRIVNLCLASVCVIILAACSGNKPETVTVEKKITVPYALQPDNIYQVDSVTEALKTATALQKAESRKLFMTGLDLLANKENAFASIDYFKEAIYYYPDEKNYQHLFKAYLKNNDLETAATLNNFLSNRIGVDEVAFNSALIAAAKKDTLTCVENLQQAIYNGFAFKERITEEKLFSFLKDNMSFQSLLVSNFGDDEKIKKNLFKFFMKTIPELNLPFEMTGDSVRSFNFDHYIPYDFALFIPGMENSRFSRDVSNEYMLVGKFKTESGTGFIYKSYQVISDTLNPVSVNLIMYDTLGTVVSQKEIGCFCSPLQSKEFKIWQDLSFEISSYKMNWQFDPLEKGYAGNKILSKEQSEHTTYKITEENLIKETNSQTEVVSDK